MKSVVATMMMWLILAHHGHAQNVITLNGGGRTAGAGGPPLLVTVTFQLSMPAAAVTSPADMTKALAGTTQSLYDIVNHECEVLTAALKGSCRLSRLNVGGSLNDANPNAPNLASRPTGGPVVTANATATFEVGTQASMGPDVAVPPGAVSPPK